MGEARRLCGCVLCVERSLANETKTRPGRGAPGSPTRDPYGDPKSCSSQPSSASQSTTSAESCHRQGKSSGNSPGDPAFYPTFSLSHYSTLQRVNHLRSQGFTPDNNHELRELLRFISNLQAQQAQQSGPFSSNCFVCFILVLIYSIQLASHRKTIQIPILLSL
jgi:hypothetical protein